jgi:AraC-like DNA-binding protein
VSSNKENDKSISLFDKTTQGALKRYLPVSDTDKQWGFIINDIGRVKIPKDSDYPSKGHPGTHMFSWEKGRILNEYQFILITSGSGFFESTSLSNTKINTGDGFLIFPGEWHRYKPARNTGWSETWVGFSGEIVDTILNTSLFDKKQPVIQQCANMLVLNLLKSLFQLVSEQPFGFQRTASGVCLQLIAEICNIHRGTEINIQASSFISKAKHLMHKKIEEDISFHVFCKNHGISYSKFRFDFKQQTGFSPLQYFILMKIEKAKDLLISSNLQTKQIAFMLGFKTDHYFCRLFKQKAGLSPTQFREQRRKAANF